MDPRLVLGRTSFFSVFFKKGYSVLGFFTAQQLRRLLRLYHRRLATTREGLDQFLLF